MPTDQDIRAYARSLPRIYQEILAAFQNIEPNRKHVERMANERYDFLRTKEIFNQCKDAAYERFKWAKKSL